MNLATRSWIVCLAVGSFVLVTGCAHVEVVEKVEERSLGTQERTTAPKGELSYLVDCRTAAYIVTCIIQVEDLCDKLTVETYERTTRLVKSTPVWATVLEWSAAAIALGVGTAVTVDAGNLPSENDPFKSNPVGKQGAYAIGASLLAAGAGIGALATIDSVRGMDETGDPEQFDQVLSSEPEACNRRPLSGHFFHARIGSQNYRVRSDASGVLSIDLEGLGLQDEILEGAIEPRLVLLEGSTKITTVQLGAYRLESGVSTGFSAIWAPA